MYFGRELCSRGLFSVCVAHFIFIYLPVSGVASEARLCIFRAHPSNSDLTVDDIFLRKAKKLVTILC